METKKILLGIKEYFLITLGILCYVLGWTIFLVPNNLIGGGVTGVASIIQYATNGAIKMGYTYFVVNAGLLIAALFVLGKNFGIKSVYAIIIASVGLNLFQDLIPMTLINSLALENGKLMSTIMGGIMVGFGIGLSFSQGGSTGGTDIIALMINKYRNISLGRLILFMDVIIILSSLIVPSYTAEGQLVPFVEKVTTVVYGLILIAVMTSVLDIYMAGSKQSVQLFVFSKKYEEIANAITRDLHRGVTVLEGQGWYTKTEAHVLIVLIRKTDLSVILRYIKSIDPDAFLSITSVSGVYGKGFDKIKEKAAKKAGPAE